MADHHVDSMDIDYSLVAKKILQSHGLFISDAPEINHKPGNDFYSDWTWPFPTYPDNRFRNPSEENLEIKDDTANVDSPEKPDERRKFPENFEILSDELLALKNIRGPMVTDLHPELGEGFIKDAIHPYTGLVIQAQEKRAYDISIVKPYFDEDGERKTKLIFRELVPGRFYSIATYDGWKFHIYRGLLVFTPSTRPVEETLNRKIYSHSIPYGLDVMKREPQMLRKKSSSEKIPSKHLYLVLDTSEFLNGEIESIPLSQVIDVEPYDYAYNFTIYEGNLKVLSKDWLITKNDESGVENTVAPVGYIPPGILYHEVIEHQFKDRCKYWNCNHNKEEKEVR